MTAPRSPGRPAGDFLRAIGVTLSDTSEAILLIDDRQILVGMNAAAERLFGVSAEQAVGSLLERFIPSRWRREHATRVREFDDSAEVRHRVSGRRALTALRGDGREIEVEITVSRIGLQGASGLRQGYAALVSEPAKTHDLRLELASVQRRMQAIFEQAPIAIWISDHEHVVYANQAAARLFDTRSPEELCGRSIYALLSPGSHADVRAQMTRAMAGESVIAPIRGNVVRADGAVLEVEVAMAPLPDDGHTMVQMVVADITSQARESARLERSRQDLRKLSESVVEAREEERRRIARELHDELGQRLTALKMDLASLGAGARLPADHPQLTSMLTMLDDTLASVRRLSTDLRPLMLDDLGLGAAIEWLAREASRRMGIEVHLMSADPEIALSDKVSTALYRMVQEALTNIARHAGATEVEIRIRVQDDRLELTVSDDGVGFPADALSREGSYGLMGMRERAQMLGGSLEVETRPEGGGLLTVNLPLAGAGRGEPDAADRSDPRSNAP